MNIGLLGASNSIHIVKIANGLTLLGHTVTVFSLPNHRDEDRLLAPGVTLVYLSHGGGKGYVLNASPLKKELRERDIAVLNAHFASGYGTLAMLADFHPYVLSVWGSDVYEFPDKSPLHRWLIHRNLATADRLLSTSQIMAERTKTLIPGHPISVTPFGIDTAVFSPVAENERKNGDVVTIGLVKAIASKYGIRELILAFDQARRVFPAGSVHVSIYGDGPQRTEMECLVQDLGLSAFVRFHGHVPHTEVPNALRSFDLFCAPSIQESFGVAVVEAMACGIPCVTSDADGFTEVMENGATGFVVPKKDINALAEKIVLLVRDGALRSKMGKAGRERALRLYDWEQNIRTIADELVEAMQTNLPQS